MPSIRKKGKKIDPEKEVKRLSRKTDRDMYESRISFDNSLKKLDKDISRALSGEIREFDKNKELLSQYLETDFGSEYERLKRKLRKI